MKKRIQSIEFFRFASTCCIAVWHLHSIEKLRHGYLPVEFFFLLSGIWLYQAYLKNRGSHYTAFQYTVDRIKHFYPKYLISCVTVYMVSIDSFHTMGKWMEAITELLLLQKNGIYHEEPVGTFWYLAVLILGGYFVYSLLEFFGSTAIKLIFPTIILMGYTYLFFLGANIDRWGSSGPFSLPLIRGMAGLCLGVCIRALSHRIEKNNDPGEKAFINLFSIVAVAGAGITLLSQEFLDKYCLLFFAGILLACLLKDSWLNKVIKGELWGKLGRYSLEMYLIHPTIVVMRKWLPWTPFGPVEKSIYIFIYLCVVFLAAIALAKVGEWLEKAVQKCAGK